jgi:hypothetical protein
MCFVLFRNQPTPANGIQHGFEPRHDDHGTVLIRNCPFRRLAKLPPEVVCAARCPLS